MTRRAWLGRAPLARRPVKVAAACGFASLFVAGTVLLAGSDADRLAHHGGRGRNSEVLAPLPSLAPHALSGRLFAGHPPPRRLPRHCVADAALARALAPLRRRGTGTIAVGIIDRATGVTASYGGQTGFQTASIVKVDILAALLLKTQRRHVALDADDRGLAAEMIQVSDNDAASSLWDTIGGAPGLAAANRDLGMRDTAPDEEAWGLTSTTVTDQLRLLDDLTSPRSPLTAASRRYELSLLRHVVPVQDWGVTAAADPGTHPAVKNGWLPMGPQSWWTINSIGVISHSGHQLLAAVLSSGQPSPGVGIARVEALAKAAAVTVTVTCRRGAHSVMSFAHGR